MQSQCSSATEAALAASQNLTGKADTEQLLYQGGVLAAIALFFVSLWLL